MEQLRTVSPDSRSGWSCSLLCAGPCYVACAADAPTDAAALAVVTGAFYYANLVGAHNFDVLLFI